MATIRSFLDEVGFDWQTGQIVYHPTGEPDEDGDVQDPGWTSRTGSAQLICNGQAPILDKSFTSGHGGPMCPRFIAYDALAIYFPEQYDGATQCARVLRDIGHYLGQNPEETPYPGG